MAVNGSQASYDIHQVAMHVIKVAMGRDGPTMSAAATAAAAERHDDDVVVVVVRLFYLIISVL